MFKTAPLYLANLNSTSEILVNQGGTYCFHPEQLIVSKRGNIPISQIIKGDEVLSYNEVTAEDEWRVVEDTPKFNNKEEIVSVLLKNGRRIICTANHKFYFKGEWVCIKHLLSLWDENNSKL